MTEQPLDEAVRSWAESSGRALELRVARDGMVHGATVRLSFPYIDPRTELVREGDVQAEWGWIHPTGDGPACSLIAVVECKSGAGKPWVAFRAPGRHRLTPNSLRDWVARSWSPANDIVDHVTPAWIGQSPFDDFRPASHVVAANLRNIRNKRDDTDNDNDEAWNAVRQVLSQSEGVFRRYTPRTPDGQERAIFVVAAIVTAAPLFVGTLSPDDSISVEQVTAVTVMGHGLDGSRQRVHVLNESELPRFARDLRERAAAVHADQAE